MSVKRVFDILFSLFLLVALSPLLLTIILLVKLGSKGPVFFRQERVGKDSIIFFIYKFRTMYIGSSSKGLLTIGDKDPRITSTGSFLRKYKLDELAQLINVLNGSMSFVGPRPEVPKYVNLYSEEQKKVLLVKPGITDPASIQYSNENDLLSKATDPEQEYIEYIMPAKLALNLNYILEQSFISDLKILFKTILKIISH